MATTVDKSTIYEHLEPRPGSFYRELFIRGLNLRASRLVAWMESEGLSPEEAAMDREIPVEAVHEAIEYARNHREVIDADFEREQQVLRARQSAEPESR